MVHALRVLRHHLLGVRRPQPFGCWTAWTDFDLADRQLGDRVEQNEATSEKDARPMARGDRGPPLRRDAPARFSENDGSPVAGQLRRWRRPRSINGRPGPREPAGALLATRSRRANPGAACVHPRRVGEHSTLRRVRLRKRPRGDCKPLHSAMRGGGDGSEADVANAPKRSAAAAARASSCTPCHCRRGAAGWSGWTGSTGCRLRRPGSTRSRTTSTSCPAT